jgi:3-hydroxyisobutyrate dehydrogenase-like beta-hydroxyacid dehydrogenase
VITNSLASNDHLKNYWPTKVLGGDVEAGFALDLAFKDLSIGVAAAAGAGVRCRPAPLRARPSRRRAAATSSAPRT